MRLKSLTHLFAWLICFQSYFLIGKTRESIPLYYISKTEVNLQLRSSEALFILRFHDGSGKAVITKPVKMSDNGVNKLVTSDAIGQVSFPVKPGKHRFQFYYSKDYFEITTDSLTIKPKNQSTLEVYFQSSKYPVICEKPVIYLYPKENTKVNVELDLKGKLGFTYPAYNDGWCVEANPDGTLQSAGRSYDYLFWEGETEINASSLNLSEGFVVAKDSLVSFFEDKLAVMGLNSREMNDFITYWVPLMHKHEHNYIHFMFDAAYSSYASLTVNPKPDQLFRVFMVWSECQEPGVFKLKPQMIESFSREGFTVVEWGGAQVEGLEQGLIQNTL